MIGRNCVSWRARALALGMASALAVTAPAMAQGNDDPSESAMINLVRLLVKQGVLTQANGDALIAQAKEEARQARAAARAARTRARTAEAPATAPAAPPATAAAPQGQATLPNAEVAAAPPPAAGTVRVPYVPEVVRNQIRDEVKAEIMAQARAENWAQPESLPEWVRRVEWSGDVRVRSQSDFYGEGNVGQLLPNGLGSFVIDWNAWNHNGPIDIAAAFPAIPILNTRTDRTNVFNVRARLAVRAKINDTVTVGARLATGNSDGPVSTTQLLGGGWNKKDIWLDQAWITIAPVKWAEVTLGRMENPFLHTDLVYDDDLNFDGGELTLDGKLSRRFRMFTTLGAFPLEYVGNNTPSEGANKAPSETKWLYGAQLGLEWMYSRESFFRAAVAYYDFDGVEGVISEPCALTNGNAFCSSDPTRPAFMQKGNTLFFLRNIIPDPDNPTNYPQPQFVGLMFDYNVVNVNFEVDARISPSYRLKVEADYVRNIAFDENEVPPFGSLGHNVNNCHATQPGDFSCPLAAGDSGWMGRVTFGYLKPREAGEWNIFGGYKYLETDAVLDAYTDSDFHLGGTNAKGYFVGGSLAVFKNTWLTARWLSADEIAGSEPLAIDVLQIDLNARF